MTPLRTALLLGTALLLCSVAAHASGKADRGSTKETPTVTVEVPGCQCWSGDIDGNDHTSMALVLCGQDTLVGTVTTTSPRSGTSVRVVNGSKSETSVQIHDTAFVIDDANAPWHFCLIDSYLLEFATGGGLRGSYISTACNDNAAVTLEYVGKCAAPELE